MPSTLRVSIAVSGDNDILIDEVFEGQFANGASGNLAIGSGAPVTVEWPRQGETLFYVRFAPRPVNYNVTINNLTFQVPVGGQSVPVLVPIAVGEPPIVISVSAEADIARAAYCFL